MMSQTGSAKLSAELEANIMTLKTKTVWSLASQLQSGMGKDQDRAGEGASE
jgi:hypothetical protein